MGVFLDPPVGAVGALFRLSERCLGVALTAGGRGEGSLGGIVDASICNGG